MSVDVSAQAASRPGAVWITGLTADSAYTLHLTTSGQQHKAGHFRTLARPPGAEVFRFATVNDVHIGERAFGHWPRIVDTSGHTLPHPQRCLRAALTEAQAWGAQMVVVKGDMTHRGQAAEFEIIAQELAATGLPVHAVLGNHDVYKGAADGRAILRQAGVNAPDGPAAVDVPGLRIVLAHTAVSGHSAGTVDDEQRQELVRLVAEADRPCFVATHHYPQRWRVPNLWPPGIPGPQARALLSALNAANPATMVASGHSHRHRRHLHQGVMTHAEIGSTKDYPGAWAGYAVHEGGIRQLVARVASPDCIAWTELTRSTVFGLWGWWAPGLRNHRCFSLVWPQPAV